MHYNEVYFIFFSPLYSYYYYYYYYDEYVSRMWALRPTTATTATATSIDEPHNIVPL